MKRITCEDCKKTYDYDKDEFCPRCGAYNRPDNTWGVDAKGNVIRVDGVNERDHAGSFVHRELHHEKDVRKRAGMDWQPPKAAQRPQAARPQPVFRDTPQPERRGTPPRGSGGRSVLKTVGIILGLIFLMNFLFPLLLMLLS